MRLVVRRPFPLHLGLILLLVAPFGLGVLWSAQSECGKLRLHVGHTGVLVHAPQLLGGGTHHAVAHQRNAQFLVNQLCSQGGYEQRVFVFILFRFAVEGYVAVDVLKVFHLACQRTLHQKDIAVQHISIPHIGNLPLQFHCSHLIHFGLEHAWIVHHHVSLFIDGDGLRVKHCLERDFQVLVRLGGRKADKTAIRVLLQGGASQVPRVAIAVGVGHLYPLHDLVAGIGNPQQSLFALVCSRDDVVGLEVVLIVVGRQDGHRFPIHHLPVLAAQRCDHVGSRP